MEQLANIIIEYANMLQIRAQNMHLKRSLRDASNPFTIGDSVFYKHYRMTPHIAIELITLLDEYLPNDPQGVPPHLQVLMIIRFLAEGPYQKGLGSEYLCPVSQTTVSKYIHIVIPALLQLSQRYIRFPVDQQGRRETTARFTRNLGFPGVLGIMDCTLIKIITPHEHEEAFLDYKRNHSINVQIVTDSNFNVMNVRICPGNTNDRFVWLWSDMREKMYELRLNEAIREQEGPYYLIADGGYTESRVLLLPYPNAEQGTPERNYSDVLRRQRCMVECVFGILKQKFRILGGLRGFHYDPEFAAQITLAIITFYQFLRDHGMPLQDNVQVDPFNDDHYPLDEFDNFYAQNNYFQNHQEFLFGIAERNQIIHYYF